MVVKDVFYASVLLVDNKIVFWKVSPNAKTENEDWYKQFYYANLDLVDLLNNHEVKTEFIMLGYDNDKYNSLVFEVLAKEFFKQWEISEIICGADPY